MKTEHSGARSPDGATGPEGSLFPEHPANDLSRGRLAFLFVLACYAVVDVSLLDWVPLKSDTADYWHVFYMNYAEVFFHHDLAHWFPYGAYGQADTLSNLMYVTSTEYLMMVIGAVFRVENVIRLFQFSLIADHLLFLFGISLLSRSLFRRKGAGMLAALGSICLLHGFQLTYLHVFRLLSWYPLILYFLIVFFRDNRPQGLWIAGLLFALWCPGNSYQPPYMLLAVLPFVLVASWFRPHVWRSAFRRSASNWLAMVACAAAVFLYLLPALNILEGIVVMRQGRTLSGAASLESFLGSRDHDAFELTLSLLSGNIFYIGLLPLGCEPPRVLRRLG